MGKEWKVWRVPVCFLIPAPLLTPITVIVRPWDMVITLEEQMLYLVTHQNP